MKKFNIKQKHPSIEISNKNTLQSQSVPSSHNSHHACTKSLNIISKPNLGPTATVMLRRRHLYSASRFSRREPLILPKFDVVPLLAVGLLGRIGFRRPEVVWLMVVVAPPAAQPPQNTSCDAHHKDHGQYDENWAVRSIRVGRIRL